MQERAAWFPFIIAAVLAMSPMAQPALIYAQNTQAGQNSQDVGAPQVLEIPVPSESGQLSVPLETQPPSQASEFGDFEPNDDWASTATDNVFPEWSDPSFTDPPSLEEGVFKRTYLGVLYATAEEGPEGVRVLSVIEGSPADRAGFEGVNSPAKDDKSGLMKAAIVVLAMSPAGPFVMPLAIAHDIYKNRHPPGDLIVAVDNKTVRSAQDFTEAMRGYQPGDSVPFKVLRKKQLLQITVALEEEPL